MGKCDTIHKIVFLCTCVWKLSDIAEMIHTNLVYLHDFLGKIFLVLILNYAIGKG